MNLVVFGASGQTGLFLVEHALHREHRVTAFVRSPEAFPLSHDRLSVVSGDVKSPEAVAAAVAGAEAVLCAIGSRQAKARVCSEGTTHIVEAMQRHGVQRLVVVTGAGVGESRERVGRVGRLAMQVFVGLEDKERQEEIIRASELDWTIVRPPLLTNDPHTGTYRVGEDLRQPLGSKLSRADLAEFMLDQVTDPTYVRKTPTLTY